MPNPEGRAYNAELTGQQI